MRRIRLCTVSELQPGQVRRVDVEGGPPLAVYNIDGALHATADTCTHARASLSEGELDGDEIICPRHFGAFHVPSGTPLCFPARRNLETFPVEVDGGVAFALVDAPEGEHEGGPETLASGVEAAR